MADRGFAQFELVGEFREVAVALGQQVQDAQPALVAQGAVQTHGCRRGR